MSGTGALRTAAGGMLRHKVQAVVIGMVLLVSTASATLGIALLAASNGPFQHAFAAQRGADIAVTVNAARASSAQLAATRTLPGVTAAAGPFAQVTVQTQYQGQPFGQLTLAGRPSPGGSVDDLVLTAGHWPDGPGQVVLDRSTGPGPGPGDVSQLGSTLTVAGVPGTPSLAVVGYANSITNTADGWVTPGEIAALRSPGAPASEQMLYSFTAAGSYAQIRADVAAVSRALPAGAVAGASSWLTAQSRAEGNGAVMEPFVVAFALIGLVMAVLIVANVVSGAVVAGYHRIGVLKSLGLTPAQVAAVYLGRVGWPALAGCLVGVVAGNLLAVPVLHGSAGAYGVGSQQVPWWASVAAPAGMLALAMLAALGPALRAGRLSAAEAIAAGRAPRADRGYAAHRLAARLPLPRPAGLGLAAPFARPARTMVTLAAIAFGDTATVNTGTAQTVVRIAGEVFQPSREPRLYGSVQTLPGVAASQNLSQYDVGLRPGTSTTAYIKAVNRVLAGERNPWTAITPDTGNFYPIAIGLVGLLALMVAVAAGLGVLNTVLMTTRDRVGDLGIFKALGMRPGQMLTMVTCWIAGPAVVAAVIAAPAAVALNTATVHAMAGTAHTGVPASFTDVFPPSRLALLSLAALVIAVAGAMAPASWAARARPATALRAE